MTAYVFPFQVGMKVVELGGGANPIGRPMIPNVDVRPGPTVDVVADFNLPLPMASNEWDGIACIYALEHINWRRVKGFIRETHRILKPGGVACFITANLLEQARTLVQSENWEEGMVCAVFGDLNYEQNSHQCGFSPRYAEQVFHECGYFSVKTLPHPTCTTDLIVEAYKSKAVITRRTI